MAKQKIIRNTPSGGLVEITREIQKGGNGGPNLIKTTKQFLPRRVHEVLTIKPVKHTKPKNGKSNKTNRVLKTIEELNPEKSKEFFKVNITKDEI